MNSLNDPTKFLQSLTGYVDPQTPVMKQCPICDTVFEFPRYQGKKYCSLRCRRKAKNFRETKRYETLQQTVTDKHSPYFMTVPNPSLDQLDKFAQLVANELTDDKPIRVIGLVPTNWKVPETIIFSKQQKMNEADQDEWIMFHPAMLD